MIKFKLHISFASAIGLSIIAPGFSSAQILQKPLFSRSPQTASTAPVVALPAGIETVDAKYKNDVLAVVQKPLLTAKFTEDSFAANPTVYKWLLDHPDRTALAWDRLGVPCLPISDSGQGNFQFKDENGTDIIWRSVNTLSDSRVWYATGKVKASPLTPMIPVKAVAIIRHTAIPLNDGTVAITPSVQAFFQTESRAATTVMKIAGNTGPKMADEGAEQLLYFFSGITKHIEKHPEQMAKLLAPAAANEPKNKIKK